MIERRIALPLPFLGDVHVIFFTMKPFFELTSREGNSLSRALSAVHTGTTATAGKLQGHFYDRPSTAPHHVPGQRRLHFLACCTRFMGPFMGRRPPLARSLREHLGRPPFPSFLDFFFCICARVFFVLFTANYLRGFERDAGEHMTTTTTMR